ncbi:alpha/beta fold hydrolase [Amycolatopsis viridis]|uniref:ABC-2 type transport system ATP-binding protein n=1 Tax=Amycolatopsis viridis TaxID=185678 RepID=A0ABX0T0N4_9PSEU|nr:alpha/beta fold hydrolase [Amycolatopsis viridis]NIH81125.1 ABC-2 type transport system ATP-binding protein [Amycolatopsis viridis]
MPRIPLPHTRRARAVTLAVVVVVLAAVALVWTRSPSEPAAVPAQDAVLDVPAAPGSAATVRLDTTLYLPAHTPAPAILLPHGFGADKTSVAGDAQDLARHGFVVLTYSARGFGHSTGEIGLNDPDFEVADATHLVDWLATRPEVRLDGPGDPRIGVLGASYGGALALQLAGRDKRIDAIAPVITYNDLAQGLTPNAATTTPTPGTPAAGAFAPDGVFKKGWAGLLFSAGSSSTAGGGLSADAPEPGQQSQDNQSGSTGSGGGSAAGATPVPAQAPPPRGSAGCGRFTDEICRAYTELATTGRVSAQVAALLQRLSPSAVTGRITAPTLLVQGEADTLFGLDQSDATARQITAAGGHVQQVWYTGGHDGGRPGPQLRAKIGDWLWFQLTGEGGNPFSGFSYDVQGSLRASGSPSVRTVDAGPYPAQAERRTLRLSGAEQTIVNPPGGTPAAVSGIPGLNGAVSGSSRLSGLFTADPPGQSARFTTAPVGSQLLVTGSSTVRLRVSGTGDAVLFAKLYDLNPDGTRTLPANEVAPIRVAIPASGTADVTVTLPGIVRPVEAGHALQLVVTTTDQAYATPVAPAAYRIALTDPVLAVPVVPGHAEGGGWPAGTVLGIAVTLAIAAAAAAIAALRRRRSHRADPELAAVPLVIDGLTKSYPGGVTAVNDLSFRVEPGQVLGLLGPNGAGKTTTLRMLMGLITPTAGEIVVFGHRVTPGAPVLSRIGSFVEGSGFLPHLSGAANLRLYWDATGRPAEQAHLEQALEIAGLGNAVHRKVRTYSQGMRQRLAIAQAMLGLPELLVLDEPTNGLDPPQIHQMREVLQRYAATGRTVVVSSHLLAEVEQTCTHVVVMHRGRLVAAGEVGDIVAAGGEATFRVDRPDAAADALRGVPGVSAVDVDGDLVHADLDGMPRADAVAMLVRAGVAVEQAGPRRRLEDVFLQLVGEDGA